MSIAVRPRILSVLMAALLCASLSCFAQTLKDVTLPVEEVYGDYDRQTISIEQEVGSAVIFQDCLYTLKEDGLYRRTGPREKNEKVLDLYNFQDKNGEYISTFYLNLITDGESLYAIDSYKCRLFLFTQKGLELAKVFEGHRLETPEVEKATLSHYKDFVMLGKKIYAIYVNVPGDINTIWEFDMATGQARHVFITSHYEISDIAPYHQTMLLMTGIEPNKIHLLDPVSERPVALKAFSTNQIFSGITYDFDNDDLYYLSTDGIVQFDSLESWQGFRIFTPALKYHVVNGIERTFWWKEKFFALNDRDLLIID